MKLPALFSDHMVLQREQPIPVWGWAAPGEVIEVALAGQSVRTVTGDDGCWRVTLPALPAGGPLEMTVSGTETTITVSDVLMGEVWVGSGQSNMEFNVGSAENSGDDIAAADLPQLRLFTVPKLAATEVQDDVEGNWVPCNPQAVTNFSAVLFYYGRELQQRLGVPVGLVHASWGGTVAEAWTSREGLLCEPELAPIVEDYEANLPDHQAKMREFHQQMARWEADLQDDPGIAEQAQGWADPAADVSEWETMDLPIAWQQAGVDISGVLWFRREVEIPEHWAGQNLILGLGACDKSDVAWFNGVQVGSMSHIGNPDSWRTPRLYPVPGSLVKAGKNVVAVRVYSHQFAGGMLGPESEMRLLAPDLADAEPIALNGPWRYAIERNFGKNPELPVQPLGPGNPHSPHTLYDGMIAPLVPYGIRGAIWYQGESNAARAQQYRTLFRALIRDWRRQWGQGDFPFYFVQLANYNASPVKNQPADSDWAELREAQTLALQEPMTGMAVIIDIGDPVDIHPRNKREVGRRLALNALAQTYGQELAFAGPCYRSMTVEGAAVRLAFDHVAGGLVAKGGQLAGFAVAGADRRFVWAEARIEGESVVVASPQVAAPVAVRYAWADNPPCSLYNTAGLPASPFRTDDWPALVMAAK